MGCCRLPLVLFIAGPLLLTTAPLLATASFDFFYLVLMWPGAYCQQSSCCLPKTGLPANDFLLKGLWTYNSTTGKQVTKCNESNFYINDLSEVKEELYLYWSNLKCPSNDGKSNWKNTWKNYGVCSNMTESDYFKAALQLRAKVDLLSLLAKKGIIPDYNLYKVSDIKSAIAEVIGATPAIQCSVGPKKQYQLYQVYICVDKDGSTIISCPIYPNFTCSDWILFHPFRYWMLNGTAATPSAEFGSSAGLLAMN